MKYKILAIDQYGNKKLIEDKKIKTLLNEFGYTSSRPMYRDINGESQKVGYVLSHKGYEPLWIELFEITNPFLKKG